MNRNFGQWAAATVAVVAIVRIIPMTPDYAHHGRLHA